MENVLLPILRLYTSTILFLLPVPIPKGQSWSKNFGSQCQRNGQASKCRRDHNTSTYLGTSQEIAPLGLSQKDYLSELVKQCGIEREHKLPCRSALLTTDHSSPKLSERQANRFRSVLQKIAYARDGRPDFDFVVCYLQSKQSAPTEQDWSDLQHLLGYVKRFPEKEILFKPTDLQLRGSTDDRSTLLKMGEVTMDTS